MSTAITSIMVHFSKHQGNCNYMIFPFNYTSKDCSKAITSCTYIHTAGYIAVLEQSSNSGAVRAIALIQLSLLIS